MCSECVKSVLRVCSECVQSMFRVCSILKSFHPLAHLVCQFLAFFNTFRICGLPDITMQNQEEIAMHIFGLEIFE